MSCYAEELPRIQAALEVAGSILERYTPGEVAFREKSGGSPVTEADLEIDAALRESLPRADEGWLSEETADRPEQREGYRRVWVVDPVDGTIEFVNGVPEWCVSVALVDQGRPVAGGILAPAAQRCLVGAIGSGVKLNGEPCQVRDTGALDGADVRASRSETRRGEWAIHADAPFQVTATGSVAFKLSLVAAGLADATWTLRPKHEWDVAGGVALILAAGGAVWTPDLQQPVFNKARPVLPGLFASTRGLVEPIRAYLGAQA